MKKIILVLIILHLTLIIDNCMCQWVWENPYPQGNPLNHAQFISENKILLIGDNGTILTTTNGGTNWDIKHNVCGILGSLKKSQFIGSMGWIVGDSGCVLKTTNEGINWTLSRANTEMSLNDLSFVNINTGFALCGNKLFKTVNGGVNWSGLYDINPLYTGNGCSIFFINENTGWMTFNGISGYPYTGCSIERTTNGGINWVGQYGMGGTLSCVKFFDSNTGYAIGGSGVPSVYTNSVILKTTNSGTNWEMNFVNLGDSIQAFNNMYFINQNTGWAASYTKLAKTTNAGINWTTYTLPKTMWHIIYGSESSFWGLSYYRIYKSTNEGNNWNTLSRAIDSNDVGYYKIFFSDNNNGWATSFNNNFIYTSNGGTNWQNIPKSNFNSIGDYRFLNSSTGWLFDVSPAQYGVLKTTNGGFNWTQVSTWPKSNYLYKIGYSDFNTIKLVGRNSNPTYTNLIYTSTNSGANWFIDSVSNSYDIYYLNSSTAWSFSADSIRRTTNSGLNWVRINTPVVLNGHIGAIFIDPNTALLYKSDEDYTNTLYKTTNAGINWIEINVSGLCLKNSFGKYYALNSSCIWIVGTEDLFNPVLIKTTDGGFNWTYDRPGTSRYRYIESVFFLNQNTGWVTTNWGEIIKTTNGGNVFVKNISTEIPKRGLLLQNYPNPFNPLTNIKYQIANNSLVTIKIYDILGKEITTLVNEKQSPGTYEITWDASAFPSGVYFYKLIAGDFSEVKKALFIK